jgi:hypothetical protein
MGAGLHIAMDVINHFYERRFGFPWPVGPLKTMDISSFPVQMRIEARFRRVLQEVLWRLGPYEITDLTVVAHSQGTMVAINTLWLAWTHRLLKRLPGHPPVTVRLATMGSPFTYLYHHYYPARYPKLFDANGAMNRAWVPKGLLFGHDWWLFDMALDWTVDRWVSLYRVDDFVGTLIDGRLPDFPTNIPVGEGGHTFYWRQAEVLDQLRLNGLLPQ